MGCGKSKHADVASGNTVLKRKTSTVQSNRRKEIKTEILKNNIDDDAIISELVEKESEIVKEVGGSNVVKDKVENEHVQEEKMLEKSKENGGVMEKKEKIISEENFEKSIYGKEDSLIKENEQILNDVVAEVKESATKEKKAMPANFEGEKDDSLKESDQKVDVVVEEKKIPETNIVMVERFEGDKEELLEKNDEEVNASLEEKEVAEKKKTKSKDSDCGKGDSLEENSQKANDDAAEVKKPEEDKREENAIVDVSMGDETLVKEEDNNKDMEPLTSKHE